jgi:ring-1,2-phenylacetyl-CoA epoxidase subunit PaaC
MAARSAPFTQALRLGDDPLILGQRLGEWCGRAPTLELDLSLANIALDLIGQATHFLAYAGELERQGRDADALAFRRDVLDFSNCLLVEQPNGDFARTIARQFLFSNFQELLFDTLAAGPDAQIAAIAAKAVKETAYHARFASEWVVRLGDGSEESRARMIDGLDWCWRFADELFEDAPDLRTEWDARIDAALAEAGLERPAARRAVSGGRAGHHSEHLGHLLSEMQFLQRAYPGATW